MCNSRYTHPKSQAFARRICNIAEIDWGIPIIKLTDANLVQLADEALQRFPDLCDSRFRETAIKHILEFQRRYKLLRHEFQHVGENTLGAPSPYKLNVSRRRL